jgi:hypothetical protein
MGSYAAWERYYQSPEERERKARIYPRISEAAGLWETEKQKWKAGKLQRGAGAFGEALKLYDANEREVQDIAIDMAYESHPEVSDEHRAEVIRLNFNALVERQKELKKKSRSFYETELGVKTRRGEAKQEAISEAYKKGAGARRAGIAAPPEQWAKQLEGEFYQWTDPQAKVHLQAKLGRPPTREEIQRVVEKERIGPLPKAGGSLVAQITTDLRRPSRTATASTVGITETLRRLTPEMAYEEPEKMRAAMAPYPVMAPGAQEIALPGAPTYGEIPIHTAVADVAAGRHTMPVIAAVSLTYAKRAWEEEDIQGAEDLDTYIGAAKLRYQDRAMDITEQELGPEATNEEFAKRAREVYANLIRSELLPIKNPGLAQFVYEFFLDPLVAVGKVTKAAKAVFKAAQKLPGVVGAVEKGARVATSPFRWGARLDDLAMAGDKGAEAASWMAFAHARSGQYVKQFEKAVNHYVPIISKTHKADRSLLWHAVNNQIRS